MTKHRFFTALLPARPLVAAGLFLLALPLGSVQAQGLRPAAGVRAPDVSASKAPTTSQRQADFIVAVVNSEPITNNELRTKLMRTEQQIKQQGMALPPRSELVPQLLERMILDRAQLQAAQASGLKIDDNAIDAAVQSVARQNQLTPEELRRQLQADGIDYSQFRAEIRDELLVSRLRQREVDARVSVSEQEIDQFLLGQQAQSGSTSLMLNLAEILLPVAENATPEQVSAQQAKAQQMLERARSGADFAALASEFPGAVLRSNNGGQMGLRSAERYPPLFVEATQKLRAGELAAPVRSGAGFHILKLLERKQGAMPDALITQTHARHILLRLSPKLSEAQAIEKLAAFKQRILAGQADFAALAREHSQDGSAKEGGDLGWASPGMFVPEFEKTMNALGANQVSDPLVSRFGVHLVQVLERREAPLSERDRREMVREALREKKQAEAYALWAQDIRGRAYVELREAPQ
jgi:peptidyl-prolyl cis-trans isomerase SurA